MRDLYHNVSVTQPLNPVVATTTKTSSAIDLQGYNSVSVVFSIGQSGDTLSGSVYWTLTIQHSDDDTSYGAIASTDVYGATSIVIDAAAEDEVVHSFGYIGNKRYLKGVATATGTHTNGTPMSIIALRNDAAYVPVV